MADKGLASDTEIQGALAELPGWKRQGNALLIKVALVAATAGLGARGGAQAVAASIINTGRIA